MLTAGLETACQFCNPSLQILPSLPENVVYLNSSCPYTAFREKHYFSTSHSTGHRTKSPVLLSSPGPKGEGRSMVKIIPVRPPTQTAREWELEIFGPGRFIFSRNCFLFIQNDFAFSPALFSFLFILVLAVIFFFDSIPGPYKTTGWVDTGGSMQGERMEMLAAGGSQKTKKLNRFPGRVFMLLY